MSFFSSDRERKLWLWVLVVLVWIYATLGPAYMLAAELRERNLLRVTFALVLLLLVAVIARRWVKQRPGWGEIGVAIGVTTVYLWTIARVESPEERTHLIEYSLVAILIYQALVERRRNGRRVPYPAILAFVATAMLGWLDEGIQAMLPNRVYDIRDVGFNVLAALMAIGAILALAWARRRGESHLN